MLNQMIILKTSKCRNVQVLQVMVIHLDSAYQKAYGWTKWYLGNMSFKWYLICIILSLSIVIVIVHLILSLYIYIYMSASEVEGTEVRS
jgi:hypothetical protein